MRLARAGSHDASQSPGCDEARRWRCQAPKGGRAATHPANGAMHRVAQSAGCWRRLLALAAGVGCWRRLVVSAAGAGWSAGRAWLTAAPVVRQRDECEWRVSKSSIPGGTASCSCRGPAAMDQLPRSSWHGPAAIGQLPWASFCAARGPAHGPVFLGESKPPDLFLVPRCGLQCGRGHRASKWNF